MLKSGCGIEKLQLETAERLEMALATYSIVAWRLLYLTHREHLSYVMSRNTQRASMREYDKR